MESKTPQQWSGKSRGGSFGHLFFIYMLRLFGVGACYVFLAIVVIYFIPFAPKATAAIWQYNRRGRGMRVLPAAFAIYAHYYRFGQVLIDKIAIGAGLHGKYKFEFENYDEFLELLNSGRGVVMIGAHVGSWETGSVFFGDYAKKMNIVMYDAEVEKIKAALEANSAETGIKVIAINEGSIESILKIKHALDDGEYVCFQGDRYVGEENTIKMNFLGSDALFPKGPFLVASKMKKPVVFYYAMRERGRKYRFQFAIVEPDALSDPEKLAQEYCRSLEGIVKKYPLQWFNFYKFWS